MRFSRSIQFLATVAAAVLFGFAVDVPALTFDQSGAGSGSGSDSGGGRDVVVEAADGEAKAPSQQYVFLVAASKYKRATKLGFTVADAEAIEAKFLALGVPETNIVLLKSPSDEYDGFPTKANIETRFAETLTRLRPGDLIVVYLSGHGVQLTGSTESFFAPEDVDPARIAETGVSINKMMDDLAKSQASFRWVIVDACRNDPTAKGADGASKSTGSGLASRTGAKDLTEISDVPASVALLQSCQRGQQSWEGGTERGSAGRRYVNGLFTASLLEALDKEKALADFDRNGTVTFSEMFQYVSRETKRKARLCWDASQEPNLSGNITDFALLSGVLREGLTFEQWNEADGLYKEACVLRRAKKYAEARRKIAEARKINKINESYQLEEETITQLADAEDEAASGGDFAKAQRYSDAAYASFQAKDYDAALRSINAALALVESSTFRKLKDSIESAKAKSESGVASPSSSTSQAQTSTPTSRPSSADDWGDSLTRAAGTARTIKIKGIDCVFHWAPPGTFEMGSPTSEEGRYDDETQHTVKLPRGFWIGETEVTQELWKAVMGTSVEDQAKKNIFFNSLYGVGSDYPMYYVSWVDCQEFVEKLNGLGAAPSGCEFRLPTEAEWEYACRAGTRGPYNGSDLSSLGWYSGNSGSGTHPVGRKTANAWGLYDTHGNVCEWCSDWYDSDYYETSPTEAPTGPTSASGRVIRGGGWSYDAGYCRSANRRNGKPSCRSNDVGLRLVLSSSK